MRLAALSSDLSPSRITAGAMTLTVHLIAFGCLILPPRPSLPDPVVEPHKTVVELIARVVSPPKPVPPIPEPPRPPKPTPTPRITPTPVTVPVQLAESAVAVPVSLPETTIGDPGPTTPAVSMDHGAQIAYDQASPPPYPSRARRQRWEGTVLLRVRVDENGRPREVVIERSSGHSLLDRTATEHVLARWRFQPAVVAGRAVGAWARVPIAFRLDQG